MRPTVPGHIVYRKFIGNLSETQRQSKRLVRNTIMGKVITASKQSNNIMKIFKMPKMTITGRTSSVTNAFVNGIIPSIYPTPEELEKCLMSLKLDQNNLRCAYCGDKATEWDHLRPIVAKKKPTGYISDIYNLVPSCSKCNQSKGNKHWNDWICSGAPLSPKTRRVSDLDDKIRRLKTYEKWKNVTPIDFKHLIGDALWAKHWVNCKKLHALMKKSQKLAETIKKKIETNLPKKP